MSSSFTIEPFERDAAGAVKDSLEPTEPEQKMTPLQYSQALSEQVRTEGTVANFVYYLNNTTTAIKSCLATGDIDQACDLYDQAKDTIRQNREDISYLSGLKGYGPDVDALAGTAGAALRMEFADEPAFSDSDYTIRQICDNRNVGMSLMKSDLTEKYGIDQDIVNDYFEGPDADKRRALGVCIRELKSGDKPGQAKTALALGQMKDYAHVVSDLWDDQDDGSRGIKSVFGSGAYAFVDAVKDLKQASPVGPQVLGALVKIADRSKRDGESGESLARRIKRDYESLRNRAFKGDAVEKDPVTGRPIPTKVTDEQQLAFDGILCHLADKLTPEQGSFDMGSEAAYRAVVGVTDAVAQLNADGIDIRRLYQRENRPFTDDAAEYALENYQAVSKGLPPVGRSLLSIIKDGTSGLTSMVSGHRSSARVAYDLTGDPKAYTSNMYRRTGTSSNDPMPGCTAAAAALLSGLNEVLLPKAIHDMKSPVTSLREAIESDDPRVRDDIIDSCGRHLADTVFSGSPSGTELGQYLVTVALSYLEDGHPIVFDDMVKRELSGGDDSYLAAFLSSDDPKEVIKYNRIASELRSWASANIDDAAYFSKEYSQIYKHVKNWSSLSDAQANGVAASAVARMRETLDGLGDDPDMGRAAIDDIVNSYTGYVEAATGNDDRGYQIKSMSIEDFKTMLGEKRVNDSVDVLTDPAIISEQKRKRDLAGAQSSARIRKMASAGSSGED